MTTYSYSFTKAADSQPVQVDDLLRLFAQAEWTAQRTAAVVETMLENTLVCLGVWDGERLIGFARAVTDDSFRAVIEDVIVDEAYRGQGIGAEIMRRLLERLEHVEEIALVCADGLIPFYEKLGFERFDMTHMHIWKGS